MSAPTCRTCHAATLTDAQLERFNAEPVTTSIYLCPDHQRVMDDVLASLPPLQFVATDFALAPTPPDENPATTERTADE